jgi:chloramphenicol-sensitive protein RarD
LLFHAATRRLPLVAIGMLQYIAPTLSLVLATAIYGEPFTSTHAIGFGGVWVGLAIFSADSVLRARALPSEARVDLG